MKLLKQGFFYQSIRAVYRLFSRPWKTAVEPPTVPTVYICSHQNREGPRVTLAYLPFPIHTWILSVFFDRNACRRQYADYTFSKRYGMPRPIAEFCAWAASGIASAMVRSTGAIPVWRNDKVRLLETFRKSLEALKAGDSLLIFPDVQYADESGSMGSIYEGFILLGRLYAKETGKSLRFVPLYCDRTDRCLREGKACLYHPTANPTTERKRIAAELVDEVNRLADASQPDPS